MKDPALHDFRTARTRVKLRADDFWLLAESGALVGDGKTELIDGEIYRMSSRLVPHARVKTRLAFALGDRLKAIGSQLEILIEASTDVADDSVPEPDIVIIGPAEERRLNARSVFLVIEVSDTTLRFDRGRKAELYASAAIPEYWVVDINGQRILIYDQPEQGLYGYQSVVRLGDPIVSRTIAGLTVETTDLIL